MDKCRLDQLVVDRGLLSSRELAQAYILRGDVLVNDRPAVKPGHRYRSDVSIRLRAPLPRFVGRGGEKLEGALTSSGIEVAGRVAIDVGASTGGFTDCLLQHGALKVYAVDVGHGQLAHSLRSDPRVVVMEGTHAKKLPELSFDPLPSVATIDVSFIALRQVLPYVAPVLARPCDLIALVKPQFELGRKFVSPGGIVRSEADQLRAVEIACEAARALGFQILATTPAALRGAKSGNQEYFVLLRAV